MYKNYFADCLFILLLPSLSFSLLWDIAGTITGEYPQETVQTWPAGVSAEENLSQTNNKFSLDTSLQNTFEDVTDMVYDLLESRSELQRRVEEQMQYLSHHALHTEKVLKSKENETSQDSADDIQDLLTGSIEQLKKIVWNIEDRFGSTITHLNQSLINHTENIDLWMKNIKKQIRSIDYSKFCRTADDFVLRNTRRLQTCCNIGVKPMQSLCQRFIGIAAEILNNLMDGMERLETCLEDKNSYLQYLLPCLDVIFVDIVTLLSDVTHLQNKIDALFSIQMFYSKFCLSMVLVEIQGEQTQIKSAINLS